MKKTWKKVGSLLMSIMVVFSMMGVPVMAEEAKAAPTEVASCTASGLWTTVLNFAFKDTAWMNAINSDFRFPIRWNIPRETDLLFPYPVPPVQTPLLLQPLHTGRTTPFSLLP